MAGDRTLQKAVMEHIEYDPSITSSRIGVAVREGVVTLSGHVPSLGEKRAAASAAGQVRGVKAVIDQIAIELPGNRQTSDELLAERAHARLASNRSVPPGRVHLAIENGTVTLHGDVDWHYQSQAAETDLQALDGIRELRNAIEIRPPISVATVRRRVRDALARIAPLDADRITVEANGTSVSLTGSVNSWHERAIAESVARAVPGVSEVANQITVA